MNDTSLNENMQNISIDPEQLKIIVGIINKCSFDLKNAKEKADEAWASCKTSLSENVTKDIDDKKEIIKKDFEKALEELDEYALKLDSVSNIWKDTEMEILSTSKEVEQLLSGISKGLFDFFTTNNKQ